MREDTVGGVSRTGPGDHLHQLPSPHTVRADEETADDCQHAEKRPPKLEPRLVARDRDGRRNRNTQRRRSLAPDWVRSGEPRMFGELLMQHERVGGDHDSGNAGESSPAGPEPAHRRKHQACDRARCTRRRPRLTVRAEWKWCERRSSKQQPRCYGGGPADPGSLLRHVGQTNSASVLTPPTDASVSQMRVDAPSLKVDTGSSDVVRNADHGVERMSRTS